MLEKLAYVNPEYQIQLDELATELVNPERFGRTAVGKLVLVYESGIGNTTISDKMYNHLNTPDDIA